MALHQNLSNTGGVTQVNSVFIRACMCEKQGEGVKIPEQIEKTTKKQQTLKQQYCNPEEKNKVTFLVSVLF